MEQAKVMARFREFSALSQQESDKYAGLCADAIALLEGRRRGTGGDAQLEAAAAATAYHRYVLLCLAAGGSLTIGNPGSGPEGAEAAAKALKLEYLRGAAKFLEPEEVLFRQTGVCP